MDFSSPKSRKAGITLRYSCEVIVSDWNTSQSSPRQGNLDPPPSYFKRKKFHTVGLRDLYFPDLPVLRVPSVQSLTLSGIMERITFYS